MKKSVTLILDSDPEIARRIGIADQFALYAATRGDAEDWLEKKGGVISRVLVNAQLSVPAGLPLFRRVLEINPQASVWLMVEKLEPWCKVICRRLGYQSVFTRADVLESLESWFAVSEAAKKPMSQGTIESNTFELQEVLPVLPFQLEHSDPLRFPLLRKMDHEFLRIFRANEVICSQALSQLPDPAFYVIREAVLTHLMLLEETEQSLLANHDEGWQHQLTEWVNWPISV